MDYVILAYIILDIFTNSTDVSVFYEWDSFSEDILNVFSY